MAKLTAVQTIRREIEAMAKPAVVDGVVKSKNDAKGEIEVQIAGSVKWVTARVVDQVPMSDLTVGGGCLLTRVGSLWYCTASFSAKGAAKSELIARHLIPAEGNAYDLGRSGQGWRNLYTSGLEVSSSGLDLTGDLRRIKFDANDYLQYNEENDIFSFVIGDTSRFQVTGDWICCYTENGILLYGTNRRLQFAATDYLTYDTTNNRFLFYIGGVCRGYCDAAGFHNGAP